MVSWAASLPKDEEEKVQMKRKRQERREAELEPLDQSGPCIDELAAVIGSKPRECPESLERG